MLKRSCKKGDSYWLTVKTLICAKKKEIKSEGKAAP